MAPKGGNAKKESGRAKKAENESKKQEDAASAKVHQTTISLSLTLSSPFHRNAKKPKHGKTKM